MGSLVLFFIDKKKPISSSDSLKRQRHCVRQRHHVLQGKNIKIVLIVMMIHHHHQYKDEHDGHSDDDDQGLGRRACNQQCRRLPV